MIQPGLERISRLLKDVTFPWKAIHVAGTNGKGSICACASALLTRRTIRNGRFTSPHLVDRWDCIQINNRPVSEHRFRRVEQHFLKLNHQEGINASEFELLTATAFQIFNDAKVDVGVIEVGMGGKLDATNILDNHAVSVIAKIAHDHQNFLGNSLEGITTHKAGILRSGVPYTVNPANEWNVQRVIDQYAEEIGAGPRLMTNTPTLGDQLFCTKDWAHFVDKLAPFQRDNMVLAYLAVVQVMKACGQNGFVRNLPKQFSGIKRRGLMPGRLQYVNAPKAVFANQDKSKKIVLDGAHNPDAAAALGEWVYHVMRKHKKGSVTWIIAMTQGKDARRILSHYLQAGDSIIATSFGPVDGMPWVRPMDPEELLEVAREIHPTITGIYMSKAGLFRAMCAAKYVSNDQSEIIVTGSLYLVGDFLREERWYNNEESAKGTKDTFSVNDMDAEERKRVYHLLSYPLATRSRDNITDASNDSTAAGEESQLNTVQSEIERVDRQLQSLEVEEKRLERTQSTDFEHSESSLDPDVYSDSTLNSDDRSSGSSNGVSPKQMFFDDVESIREQLAKLPTATHRNNNY